MPPLLVEEEIDVMDFGDEPDDEPMSTDMLKYIGDDSQSHTNVNRGETHYKYVIVLSKDNQDVKER